MHELIAEENRIFDRFLDQRCLKVGFPIEGLNKTAEELAGTYPGLLQLAKLREATQSEYNGAVAKTLPSFQLVYSNSIAGMNAPAPIEPARSNSLVFQLK